MVWGEARRKVLTAGVAAALVLAVLLRSLIGGGTGGERSALATGDFPAFYAAAVIISRGEGAKLYDRDKQAEIQHEFWPSDQDRYSAFAYPPFYAVLQAPLAWFSPQTAKGLHTVFMLALLASAIHWAAFLLPAYQTPLWRSLTIHLACFPILIGVAGGQNVALSLLLLVLSLYWVTKGRELAAGVALGLWLFKPQYSAPLLLFVTLAGYPKVLLGAVLPASFYYLIGAHVSGWLWPFDYLQAALQFATEDDLVNGYQMISLPALFRQVGLSVNAPVTAKVVALLLVAAVVAVTTFFCLHSQKIERKGNAALLPLLLASVAVLLISPHALFYDMGIIAPAVVTLLRLQTDREISALVLIILVVNGASLLRSQFLVTPLCFLVIIIFLALLFRCYQQYQGIGKREP